MKAVNRLRLVAPLLVLIAVSSGARATPVKPKLADLIKQAEHPRVIFPPARVAWNGPEQTRQAQPLNMLFERFGPEGSNRAARASLVNAAMPDLRALVAIALIIVLLRLLRTRNEAKIQEQATVDSVVGNQQNIGTAAPDFKAA